MDSQLRDHVVLVTGASGGIGGEVVRAFATEGARIVAHFHTGADAVQNLVDELGVDRCLALEADLTEEPSVERLFDQAEERWGPITVVVANAGYWPADDVPLEKMTLQQWNSTLAINLTAPFLCVRRFFRGIVEHSLVDPSVVLIGSTAGLFGEAGHADYAAAKAALTYGLARSLKNEIVRLAPRGRINVVCPGWTVTPMTKRYLADPEKVREVLQTVPLRKPARAHDVAMAVVYLASSHLSGHVTGQVLTVSGGMEGRVLWRADET